MAARENQGYMIAIILLVLLTVVLAISTYFGFTKMNEFADQKNSAETRLAEEQKAAAAYENLAAILMSYLGVEGHSVGEVAPRSETLRNQGQADISAMLDKVNEAYNSDMQRFVNKQEGVDATWRGLVDDFGSALAQKHNQVTVLTNNVRRAEQEKQAELDAKQKTLDETAKQLTTAKSDFDSEKKRHDETRTRLQSALDQASNENQLLNQKYNEAVQTHQQDIGKFEQDTAAKNQTIASLRTKLEAHEPQELDVADGRILSVAPLIGMVYINLGSDDSLQPKQTFSIYDQALDTFTENNPKAKIEVTRIIGPHLAEARITSSDDTDPVLTHDHVATSTWDPGYAVPIAVGGFIDIDGDGISDLARLISRIRQNGGEVVAYHDEEGNLHGKIDEQTRYYIVGEDPTGNALVNNDPTTAKRVGEAFSDLNQQAQNYSVRRISVRELLNSMGYRSEARVHRSTGDDDAFQPRNPPNRANPNSAFDR